MHCGQNPKAHCPRLQGKDPKTLVWPIIVGANNCDMEMP